MAAERGRGPFNGLKDKLRRKDLNILHSPGLSLGQTKPSQPKYKMNRSDLHSYQERTIRFICEKKRCGLFLDMGLGKTVSTLTAISDLINASIIKKALVIAPLRVCNSVWRQEGKKWTHLSHLRINIATGTDKARRKALNAPGDVFVINRENTQWLIDTCVKKKQFPFDAVIIDESSSFKNPSSKRFRKLKKIIPYTTIMVLLTGTPSPNGLLDLWAQIFLIDQGKALGRTMTAYKQRFFNADYWGYTFKPKYQAPEKIYELIDPMVLSMRAEDYIEVSDRIDIVETVELSAKVKRDYDDFEKNLFLEFQDVEVEALSAAVLANKLLQFANGAIYTDEEHNWKEIHNAKLDALSEIIEENPNENILLIYNYKHDLFRIQKRFPQVVLLDKKPQTIEDWNAGKIPLITGHPGSMAHGINLQYGGALIIWFGLTWNLEYDRQAVARLHRQGQEHPVRVVRIVSAGTIDQRVLSVLEQKDAVQNDLLQALRSEI